MTVRMLLDHIAIRVDRRTEATNELIDSMGWTVFDHTEKLTLLGADDATGKLTLLDASSDATVGDAARVRELYVAGGPEVHILDGITVSSDAETAHAPGIVGVVVEINNPDHAMAKLLDMPGLQRADERTVLVGDQWVRLVPSVHGSVGLPLDHIGIQLESIGDITEWASNVDHELIQAARSTALFVPWHAGARIEYIDVHSPARVRG